MTLPLVYSAGVNGFDGISPLEREPYAAYDPIRQIERASIRHFMEQNRQYLKGRVLDFGAGKQPYKDLVEGEYVAHEKGDAFPAYDQFAAVMLNQVLQYVDDPAFVLGEIRGALRDGGYLVMTYASNWTECEITDLWRFTRAGMERLLIGAGFTILAHELRAEVSIGNFAFPLGYGVVARK